jgi:hypothetical protein
MAKMKEGNKCLGSEGREKGEQREVYRHRR